MQRTEPDTIATPPMLDGPHGFAWRIPIGHIRARLGKSPDEDATICMWIVEAKWAHPIWHSYLILLVHLRPMPDGRPPKIYLEGATHELTVHAMDPDKPRGPLIAGEPMALPVLTPTNFAAQLICPSDEAAAKTIELAVTDIVHGKLNPDTDARQQWIARFGDSMIRKRLDFNAPTD